MNKYDALSEIFNIEAISTKIASGTGKSITCDNLLKVISKPIYTLNTDLGVSSGTITRLLVYLWPDRGSTNTKVCTYLLNKYGLKYCTNCCTVKEEELFSRNAARPDGRNNHCKECCVDTRREYQREYQARVRALKLDRTPKWANLEKIKEMYTNCPEGHHVDHIVPLQGDLVSGLHVHYNLQYLLAVDNQIKGNKFNVS